MNSDNNTFARIFDIESRGNCSLTVHQQRIGDVSCVVWDAALVLAKYLDVSCRDNRFGTNWLRGKNVFELGAGVGCVGMTAACLGARVVMTDLKASLPMLQRNIDLNKDQWERSGGSACAEVLAWGEPIPTDIVPDIVLLADCVYYKESIDPLLKTIQELCARNPDSYVLMSQEERDTPRQIPVWREFGTKLREKFVVDGISPDEQDPTYSSEDIHLLRLSLRKNRL